MEDFVQFFVAFLENLNFPRNCTDVNCSSDFLWRPQKGDKISQLIWPLFSKFQINWKILSIFCGLLRKAELYLNSTDANCSSGFLRRPQKVDKKVDKISQWIWPLLNKFQINWKILSILHGLLRKAELYLNWTNANCGSNFLRRPQKVDKRTHLIWPLLSNQFDDFVNFLWPS